MANKRYYWLKLKDDFFRDKAIKKLRRIAGGDTYVIIYLKMQLLSLKSGGKLFYDGVEDDFCAELALDLDEDTENVKITVSFLQAQGLLEQCESDTYFMTAVPDVTGSECYSAERVRRHRALQCNEKKLQCNSDVTSCNEEIEIEKELEKEKDIEKDSLASCLAEEKNLSTFQQSESAPTLEMVRAYAESEDIQTDVQKFYSYYEERNWKTKKGKSILDMWKIVLKRWGEQEGCYPAASKKKNPNDYHVDEKKSAAYRSLIYNIDEYDL